MLIQTTYGIPTQIETRELIKITRNRLEKLPLSQGIQKNRIIYFEPRYHAYSKNMGVLPLRQSEKESMDLP